jgi:hypothetical protein
VAISASREERRRYEERVMSEVHALLAALSGPGRHTLNLIGRYPDTTLVITGPGLKKVAMATWQFELWGSVYEPYAERVETLDGLLEEIPHQIVLAGMAQ